ncbi:MAG: MBL fold metallo-hydrolase [Chloroflexi bacterium]|nr:MAG: MBL fold metallo-hydrolase [Chloroflexota bacterium]MBL1193392.1 MBL fold metallo-hydrolase [Chloroflexota bacterium]NOH10684.1 MBL fold metallo-hydrolase [Chloroflexota bacterium]
MPELIILGTSFAIPSAGHDNSHMVLVGDERTVMIDCVNNPVERLAGANLRPGDVSDIFMSHLHPDHVSGVPLLLMAMGLNKRTQALNLFGLQQVNTAMQAMLDFYDWSTWHDFEVIFNDLPEDELTLALPSNEFNIYTSPVKHFIPTLGFRIEFTGSGKVLAYSCDTAPTPALSSLAKDADVFIHEAAGASLGHSSAAQAGEVAKEAGAKELYLIHYPTGEYADDEAILAEASEAFGKPAHLTQDYMEFEF